MEQSKNKLSIIQSKYLHNQHSKNKTVFSIVDSSVRFMGLAATQFNGKIYCIQVHLNKLECHGKVHLIQ